MSATKQPTNIGKRCYFHIKHDIWTFGYIMKEDSGYYTIRSDDGVIYEREIFGVLVF